MNRESKASTQKKVAVLQSNTIWVEVKRINK